MNKKSSSFFRVDEQVFFTMGGLCILSLMIMAFRFSTRTPCLPVKIEVRSTRLITQNAIQFNAETQAAGQTFSWNFGDGTSKDEEMPVTEHEYKVAGKYTVTVLVNGQCTDMREVVINEAPVQVNTDSQPLIFANPGDTAYTGQPVKFSDISTASTKWEWRFGETSSIDATDKNPTYTYTIPGRYVVRLKVNDKAAMSTSYSIYIIDKQKEKAAADARVKANLPRPVAPQVILPAQPHSDPLKPVVVPETPKVEAKPKGPAVTGEQLAAMLKQVAEGSKTAADFSDYLGGQLGISVLLNKDVMPFTKMCEQLKSMKKIKSISVLPTIDKETNHVLSMTVSVEKKKVLGIF